MKSSFMDDIYFQLCERIITKEESKKRNGIKKHTVIGQHKSETENLLVIKVLFLIRLSGNCISQPKILKRCKNFGHHILGC